MVIVWNNRELDKDIIKARINKTSKTEKQNFQTRKKLPKSSSEYLIPITDQYLTEIRGRWREDLFNKISKIIRKKGTTIAEAT